jgi:hypothetical protein
MGTLSDVVQLTITAEAAKATQAGFGMPLIVSHSAGWVERVREYSDLAAVAVDFATTTPEYIAASKIFGQTPRPPKVLVGRAALRPTQRYALTPVVLNSYTYRVTVNGAPVSFTSDASATANEIILGLKAAIDALALPITTTDQTTFLRVQANTPGAFVSVSSGLDPNLLLTQDHVDPGLATDLAAIALERNDWYAFVTLFNSKALIEAGAAWAAGNKKLYLAQTSDGAVANTVSSGTDDVGESLASLNSPKTALVYSPDPRDFADAAALGRCLPIEPGEETWKFKTLAGVTSSTFTGTQRANLRAKRVNFYEPTAGVAMLEEGIVSSGSYIDAVRYLDFLEARIQERVFSRLAAPNKIPYNDRGIAVVEGEIRGQLESDETREALLPGWSVSVPKAAAATAADRTARLLRNVSFSAVYAGAIHKVLINGTVTF